MPDRPLTVLHAFSTFELGGPQSRFLRLFDALGDGYRHVVAAMDNCFDAAERIRGDPRLELLRLPVRKGRGLGNVGMLRDRIAQVAPDVLMSYNWGASEWMFANARLRVPQLHVEEGFGPEETVRRLPRRSIARALAVRASGATLVTVSQTLATIARREWHVPARRLVVVPNGVDTARFRPVPRPGASPLARHPGEIVVGTVAGLRGEKRIDRLVDAVAIARGQGADLRLVVAGDGPERAALQQRAADAGLAGHCEWLGLVADPQPFYAGLDVFALSSDTEQMPLALLEAMAGGLPVAATDVGDVRLMLAVGEAPAGGAPGLVVERSAPALAAALARLATDAALRAATGAHNRRIAVERFDAHGMVDSWRRLLDQAAGRSAAPELLSAGSFP